MNVSSILVKTKLAYLEEVIASINSLDLCEVHFFNSDGKIIVTIEGESISDQMDRLKKIQSMPFVFSASLAYSYCEDELTRVWEEIEGRGGQVPGELKDT